MANDPVTVKGKVPNKPAYNIDVVIDQVSDEYYAESKAIPPLTELPEKFDGQSITWFNNFGIKVKSNPNEFVKGKIAKPFRISLDLPDGKRLCIYDNTELDPNNRLKEITAGPSSTPFTYQKGSGNRITFMLNLGDPPTGIFP